VQNGTIAEHGTYDNLTSKPGLLHALMNQHFGDLDDSKTRAGKDVDTEHVFKRDDMPQLNRAPSGRRRSISKSITVSHISQTDISQIKGADIIDDEHLDTTSVPTSTYLDHAKQMGSLSTWALLVALLVFSQGATAMSAFVLGNWSTGEGSDGWYAGLYAASAGTGAVLTLFRGGLFARMNVAASRQYHARLFLQIVRAPAIFFDATPG
jgi:hypothetical protein